MTEVFSLRQLEQWETFEDRYHMLFRSGMEALNSGAVYSTAEYRRKLRAWRTQHEAVNVAWAQPAVAEMLHIVARESLPSTLCKGRCRYVYDHDRHTLASSQHAGACNSGLLVRPW